MNKKILMIAGAVVVLLGGAGGGFMMMKKSAKPKDPAPTTVEGEVKADAAAEGEAKAEAPADGKGEAKAEGKEGDAKGGPPSRANLTYQFDTFQTNLSDDVSTLVQMKIQVETGSMAYLDQLKDNLAPLRDATIMLLSSKTKEDLQTQAGKERFKRELLVRFQGVMNSSKVVRNIYISDFVVVRT